jgi:hypothetical protein
MTTARDTIVDALDLESFVLCAGGLKAPNMTAQGNALGLAVKNISSPERAAQTSRTRLVSPFQGVNLFLGYESRGVAPGYHVIALSARDADRLEKFQTRLFQTRLELVLDTGIANGNP